MDFLPTGAQEAARALAAEIFGDLSTPERLGKLGGDGDARLWKELCGAGLVAAVEETGLLGLALMLEEQGRRTAQVPFAATCVYGLLPVGASGTREQRARWLPALRAGTAVVTGAFPLPGRVPAVTASRTGRPSPGGGEWRLNGVLPVVPWLREATHVLVPARCAPEGGVRCFLVETGRDGTAGARGVRGVQVVPVETTAPWSAGRLTLEGASGEALGDASGEALGSPPGKAPGEDPPPRSRASGREGSGGEGAGREGSGRRGSGRGESGSREPRHACGAAYRPTLDRVRIAYAALQAGVCAGSLARAVEHTGAREQFGRPLSTHQGVQLRAADAYMDTEAIRVTVYEAAWRHDQGLDAYTHALTAAWWASEAGRRVVHSGQHLHGGIGADLGHPVHRHFLWGRQLDACLGSPGALLAELGEALADMGDPAASEVPAATHDPAPREER